TRGALGCYVSCRARRANPARLRVMLGDRRCAGMTIRVTLLDDPPALLDTLHDLLRGADDVTVVARGKSGHEALAALLAPQGVVTVLDLRVPVIEGVALLDTATHRRLGVRVVLLTGADNPGTIRRTVSFIAHTEMASRERTAPRDPPGPDPVTQDVGSAPRK